MFIIRTSTFVPILSQINPADALAIMFLEDPLSYSHLPLVRLVSLFISRFPINTLYACCCCCHHNRRRRRHKLWDPSECYLFNLLSLSNWNSRKCVSHAEFYVPLTLRLCNLTHLIPSSLRLAFGLFLTVLFRHLASSQTVHNSTDSTQYPAVFLNDP